MKIKPYGKPYESCYSIKKCNSSSYQKYANMSKLLIYFFQFNVFHFCLQFNSNPLVNKENNNTLFNVKVLIANTDFELNKLTDLAKLIKIGLVSFH